jgi:hypothetical protein
MSDELKIDFGDGVSALDRTLRAVVFMIDGAIGELIKLGYRRDLDHITVVMPDDGLPGLEMRGERVYEVLAVPVPPVVSIQGHWVKRPPHRTWLRRWFTRRYRAGAT